MDYRLTAIEKAFELARSTYCPNVDFLKKRLKSEGYDTSQICGKALKQQLLELIEKGKKH